MIDKTKILVICIEQWEIYLACESKIDPFMRMDNVYTHTAEYIAVLKTV